METDDASDAEQGCTECTAEEEESVSTVHLTAQQVDNTARGRALLKKLRGSEREITKLRNMLRRNGIQPPPRTERGEQTTRIASTEEQQHMAGIARRAGGSRSVRGGSGVDSGQRRASIKTLNAFRFKCNCGALVSYAAALRTARARDRSGKGKLEWGDGCSSRTHAAAGFHKGRFEKRQAAWKAAIAEGRLEMIRRPRYAYEQALERMRRGAWPALLRALLLRGSSAQRSVSGLPCGPGAPPA